MKYKLIPLFLSIVCCHLTLWAQQDYDESDENIQFVSWGITAGPNLTGCRVNLDSTDGAPDKTHPALGIDAGAFLEYHITPHWSLQFAAAGNIACVRTEIDGLSNRLTTYGTTLSMLVCHRWTAAKGFWFCTAGPFTHFIFANSISGEGALENPFTRVIANDPRTGEPQFAMNDFNAGIALNIGYEWNTHWQWQIYLDWGITDLLNVDSHDLYVKPYKLGILLAYHFL